MKQKITKTLAVLAAVTLGQAAVADTQGVTDTQVVFGSVNDLSGIFAAVGVPAVNGANLRFKQANDAGGVHGRMLSMWLKTTATNCPARCRAITSC